MGKDGARDYNHDDEYIDETMKVQANHLNEVQTKQETKHENRNRLRGRYVK